jgi:hypothetical protein
VGGVDLGVSVEVADPVVEVVDGDEEDVGFCGRCLGEREVWKD